LGRLLDGVVLQQMVAPSVVEVGSLESNLLIQGIQGHTGVEMLKDQIEKAVNLREESVDNE